MIPFNECKLALEREIRTNTTLKHAIKQAKDQHEESLQTCGKELQTLQSELSKALSRVAELERTEANWSKVNARLSSEVEQSNIRLAAQEEEMRICLLERDALKGSIGDIKASFQQVNIQVSEELSRLSMDNEQLQYRLSKQAEDSSEKGLLVKELTSKNLELLARITTFENSVKPLFDDMKV